MKYPKHIELYWSSGNEKELKAGARSIPQELDVSMAEKYKTLGRKYQAKTKVQTSPYLQESEKYKIIISLELIEKGEPKIKS